MAEPASPLIAQGKAEVENQAYDAAVATLTRALEERPGDVDALFYRGLALLRKGDYAAAERDYAALLERAPEHGAGRYNRAWCLQKAGKYAEAEADYGRFLEREPNDVDALLERGRCRLELQKDAAAQEDLDRADRLKPENAEIRFQRGRARMGQGHWELAIKDFEAAVGINPEYTNSWFNRGWCRGKMGDHAGAAEDFTRYIGLYPDRSDAYLQRGNRRLDLCDLRGTLADYEKAISLNASLEPDLRSWIDLVRRMEKLERDGPNDQFVAACLERGNAKRDGGEHASAQLWYDRALEVDPNASDVLHGRAQSFILMERHADAIRDCSRAIEIKPHVVDYWHDRARAKRMSGDKSGAVADFTRALELKPDYLYSLAGRAFTYTLLEDFANAVKDYESYVLLEPKAVADIWFNLGWSRRKLGRPAEAIEPLSKAIELNPSDPDAWCHRGYARKEAGDPEGARSDLRKAIELKPELKATLETYIADMDAPARPAAIPATTSPPLKSAPPPTSSAPFFANLKSIFNYLVVCAIVTVLGIARVPFVGDIPARAIDMPYKLGWIFAHWNDEAAFPSKSDLCMEPFCVRTDTSEKHVGGRARYTSEVEYNYCGEHGPTFFSTGHRFDGFLYFIYWSLILLLSLLLMPFLALPFFLLGWPVAALMKRPEATNKLIEGSMWLGAGMIGLGWILFAWW